MGTGFPAAGSEMMRIDGESWRPATEGERWEQELIFTQDNQKDARVNQ
jgi:hypothetical protein